MEIDGRVRFAEQVAALREQAGLSLAEVAAAAHVVRGYVHHIEHGRRWPTHGVAQALDNALDAQGALLATWQEADALPRAAAAPADPEDRERVALAARHPRRVDATAVGAAVAAERPRPGSSAVAPDHPVRALYEVRNAVLGPPLLVPMSVSAPVALSAASLKAAAVQAHRRYQLAEYDATARLLPAVLTCLQSRGDDYSAYTTAAAYLAAAKLATKLGDIGLASVTADRAMTAAKESEHAALIGSATYQVACALLLTGELTNAEQILTLGAENIASVAATPRLNCRREAALSVRGSLLLLLAIIAARRSDHNAAQNVLREAGQLAEQLGCDGNWLWTAFGPTNVAIHQLSVQSRLGNSKKATQIAENIDANALPAVLRGRRSQVHLEMAWTAAGQADDAVAVLHLLEAERVAEQAVSRNASARTLLSTLLARERRSDTPGLRGLAARAGLLP